MLAIQVMQAIVRDARMREQAHAIQSEVRRMIEDLGRLRERTARLATHLRQANEDMEGVGASMRKIAARGDRILQLEFEDERQAASPSHGQSATFAFEAPERAG